MTNYWAIYTRIAETAFKKKICTELITSCPQVL